MSARTVWVSKPLWRALPLEVRRAVVNALPRSPVPEYAGNIESALRRRGEHATALAFLQAVAAQMRGGDV